MDGKEQDGSSNNNGGSEENNKRQEVANILTELLTGSERPMATNNDVLAALAGDLSAWLANGSLQPRLRDSQIQQVVDLANTLGSREQIRTAFLYLLVNQWDTGAALQQWTYDERARGPAVEMRRTLIDWNRTIDRQPALRTDPSNAQKHTIRVKKGTAWTKHEYPGNAKKSSDSTEPQEEGIEKRQDLLRLNKWRDQILRRIPYYPPQKKEEKDGKRGKEQGEWWHPLEKRVLDNLWKATKDGVPEAARCTQSLNDLIQGLQLPGSITPTPQRRPQQITGYINRTWMNKVGPNTPMMKARNAKALLRAQQARDLAELEKILDEGNLSTMNDFRAVEEEVALVIKKDGFPLTEDDFKEYGEDEDVGPPSKKPKTSHTTDSRSTYIITLETPKSHPEGSNLQLANYAFNLSDDFALGLEPNTAGEPMGPFYRTGAFADEIAYEQANIGAADGRAPLTHEAWGRIGGVVMAYYFTHQTPQDRQLLDGFLRFVGVPAHMQAGVTSMDAMLLYFDLKKRGG